MPVLGPEAVATLTIGSGILAILIAFLFCALTRITLADIEGLVKSFSSFAFSTAPLALLLWNCIAINWNAWQGNTDAIEKWNVIASDTQHIFGIGTTLLAYATLSTIVAATMDLATLVRQRISETRSDRAS